MAFRSAAGSGLNQGATSEITITIPSDVAAGDVLALFVFNREADADVTVTDDDSGGEAWVKKGHVTTQKDAGDTGRVQLWWKRATSGTASKTITVGGYTNSCCGVMAAYSGRLASGDPFNVFLGEDNAHGDETMAEITPTEDGCDVVLCVGTFNDVEIDNQACTDPGPLTERAYADTFAGGDCAVALADAPQTTAGATGTFTWSQSNDSGGSIAFALAPEGGGGAVELVIQDATIGLAADAPALTQAHSLAVQDAAVALGAEVPTLVQQHILTIADAAIALAAESPALAQANVLGVPDTTIAVTAEQITLSLTSLLEVADAAIAVVADGVVLTQANQLAVADTLITVAADHPNLVQAHVLAVDDALVALVVDSVVLLLPASFTTAHVANVTLSGPRLAGVTLAGPRLTGIGLSGPRLSTITLE